MHEYLRLPHLGRGGPGFMYLICCNVGGVYRHKIGYTQQNPDTRFKQLATGFPGHGYVLDYAVVHSQSVEFETQARLSAHCVGGEWFDIEGVRANIWQGTLQMLSEFDQWPEFGFFAVVGSVIHPEAAGQIVYVDDQGEEDDQGRPTAVCLPVLRDNSILPNQWLEVPDVSLTPIPSDWIPLDLAETGYTLVG